MLRSTWDSRGGVHHAVGAGHERVHRARVLHVAGTNVSRSSPSCCSRFAGCRRRRQPVEHGDDDLGVGEEGVDEMGADEARAAGDAGRARRHRASLPTRRLAGPAQAATVARAVASHVNAETRASPAAARRPQVAVLEQRVERGGDRVRVVGIDEHRRVPATSGRDETFDVSTGPPPRTPPAPGTRTPRTATDTP